MAEQNISFIKGGLPLGSGDFINGESVRENKNRLLAALENINRVHEEKMSIPDSSFENNDSAVDLTMDVMNQDSFTPPTTKDEYVFSDQIIRSDEELPSMYTVENPTTPTFGNEDENSQQPMFSNDQQMTPMEDDIVIPGTEQNGDFESFDMENVEQQSQEQLFSDNQGEPMIVLDEQQVGKRGSGKSKGKGKHKNVSSSEEIKAGKGVAWLAYILFFIPLLFKGKNKFVRYHANEALSINLLDLIGVGLYLVGYFISHTNEWISLALMLAMVVGMVLIVLTTITKIVMIFMTLSGKEARSPWFGKMKLIKY